MFNAFFRLAPGIIHERLHNRRGQLTRPRLLEPERLDLRIIHNDPRLFFSHKHPLITLSNLPPSAGPFSPMPISHSLTTLAYNSWNSIFSNFFQRFQDPCPKYKVNSAAMGRFLLYLYRFRRWHGWRGQIGLDVLKHEGDTGEERDQDGALGDITGGIGGGGEEDGDSADDTAREGGEGHPEIAGGCGGQRHRPESPRANCAGEEGCPAQP